MNIDKLNSIKAMLSFMIAGGLFLTLFFNQFWVLLALPLTFVRGALERDNKKVNEFIKRLN